MHIGLNHFQSVSTKTALSQKGKPERSLQFSQKTDSVSDSAREPVKAKNTVSPYDAYARMRGAGVGSADNISTAPLNDKYTITVDAFTGIECLKIKGNEGGGYWILTSNEQQREKLQDLANIYKEKYPNLIKSDSMAIAFAEAEIGGMAVRTENGILSLTCNGMHYMADKEPSKSWCILYPINNTYMYTEIMNAMKEGYITGSSIEDVSKWEAYFKDRELEFERVLSDEELEALLELD